MKLKITFKYDWLDKYIGYWDSNWATSKERERSTGNYIFFHLDEPIFNKFKQKATVGLSLTMTEYLTIIEAKIKAL